MVLLEKLYKKKTLVKNTASVKIIEQTEKKGIIKKKNCVIIF